MGSLSLWCLKDVLRFVLHSFDFVIYGKSVVVVLEGCSEIRVAFFRNELRVFVDWIARFLADNKDSSNTLA